MDVVDFVREYHRMCDNYDKCSKCPVDGRRDPCTDAVYEDPQGVVEIVEQWAKEHPVQTNADKFKEVFGKIENALRENWWDEPYKVPKEDNG